MQDSLWGCAETIPVSSSWQGGGYGGDAVGDGRWEEMK